MHHRQAGFSIVEVILATAIFSILVGALSGMILYGQTSAVQSGDRVRANLLAEEGMEAVRNIRDANYASLVDGTYGLVQSGGSWSLAGSNDTSGVYTRQVTIASAGANRKDVSVNVTWNSGNANSQATVNGRLTNWLAAVVVPKTWPGAIVAGGYDASGTQDGLKIVTAGNLAYVVRNTGTPNFLVVNISNPAAPTLTGSLNLAGNPTNLFVSGNHAYVTNSSDSAELQIINIATPASPSLAATYNAAGTGNGQSVFVNGNNAFLARAADTTSNELIILNVATPSAPALVGGYNNNISMTDVLVSGDYIYVGTNSTTTEILQLSALSLALPVLSASTDLATSGAVTDMKISGTTMLVSQAASLSILNITNPLSITRSGTVTLSSAPTINDITIDSANTFAFLGTSNTAAEFQIVNYSTPASASVVRTVDLSGTASNLTGVAYNSTLDVVAGTGALDSQEVTVFVKN